MAFVKKYAHLDQEFDKLAVEWIGVSCQSSSFGGKLKVSHSFALFHLPGPRESFVLEVIPSSEAFDRASMC